jgi:hypothetical protein
MKTQELKATSSLVNITMVGTAVELEGVTINVLVLNPEKIVK